MTSGVEVTTNSNYRLINFVEKTPKVNIYDVLNNGSVESRTYEGEKKHKFMKNGAWCFVPTCKVLYTYLSESLWLDLDA
jgi:hypothetical protein